MMNYGWDIGGEVVKQDDRYTVKDNTVLTNLVLSSTELRPFKSTTGHKHEGQEEVYIFVRGSGNIELDGDIISFREGSTVLIKDGVFHRVHSGKDGCYFICVFDGRRNH